MSNPANILLITCHDLGRFLGCYGITSVHTPHIDALAADAVLFERAFCAAPQCSPSRAALFTGRYPHANGVMGLTQGNFGWDLHPDEKHLAAQLRARGYRTAMIGIHHESMRSTPEAMAARCGFDVFARMADAGEITRAATDLLARYAQDGDARPFYMQVGFFEPHRIQGTGAPDTMGFTNAHIRPDDSKGIYVPPYLRDTPSAREELAELQGAVRYIDGAVGGVLQALHDLRLADRTLVIFTTDHGVALPRAKCSLYDPGIETALIMRMPGRGWRGGRRIDGLVSNVDILPTIMDLIGQGGPGGPGAGEEASPPVQGVSFRPLVEGHAPVRDRIYAEFTFHNYYDPKRCVRTGRHKLILNFTAARPYMDPSQSWRPRTEPKRPTQLGIGISPLIELYDLEQDPWELDNLAEAPEYEPVKRSLLADLHRWMKQTYDPLLDGPIPSPTHTEALAALAASDAAASEKQWH